jgi:hypothetical protein
MTGGFSRLTDDDPPGLYTWTNKNLCINAES